MVMKKAESMGGMPVNTHDIFFNCRQCQRKLTEFDLRVNGQLYNANKLVCADCLIRTQKEPPRNKWERLWYLINYLFPPFFLAYVCYGFIMEPDWFYLFHDIFLYYIPLGGIASFLGGILDFILFPVSCLSILISVISMFPFLKEIFNNMAPKESRRYISGSVNGVEIVLSEIESYGRDDKDVIKAVLASILLLLLKIVFGWIIFPFVYIPCVVESRRWKKGANMPLIKTYLKVLKQEEWEKKKQHDKRLLKKYNKRYEQLKKQYTYLRGEELHAAIRAQLKQENIQFPLEEITTDEHRYYAVGEWTDENNHTIQLVVDKDTLKWCIIYRYNSSVESTWANKKGTLFHKLYIRYKNMSLDEVLNVIPWDLCAPKQEVLSFVKNYIAANG